MRLTEEQKSLLDIALRVAAEKFAANASVANGANQAGLAEVFNRQEHDAYVLADLVSNADYVEVVE